MRRGICERCEAPYIAKAGGFGGKRFCSVRCREAAYYEKFGINLALKGIPAGTVGAIGEIRVCADLMIKGLEVFRALSPSSRSDLIVVVGNTCHRVSVKTGYKSDDGQLLYPKEKHPFDIIAIATPKEIVYLDNRLRIFHADRWLEQ